MPRKKKTVIPVLALRGLMVFPGNVLQFDAGRERSVAAVQQAMSTDQRIFLVPQKDEEIEDPTENDLCAVGTVAVIRQVMHLPGEAIRVLAEGITRGSIAAIYDMNPYIQAAVTEKPDVIEGEDIELQALTRTCRDAFSEYAQESGQVTDETVQSVMEIGEPGPMCDAIAANVLVRMDDRMAVLEETDVRGRLEKLCAILMRETELSGIEKRVQARIHQQVEKNQKDYYLREQIKAIQTELGDDDGTETEGLRERMEKTPLSEEARQKCAKEIERLGHMAPGTPEVGVSRTYIEWILDLPWGKTT